MICILHGTFGPNKRCEKNTIFFLIILGLPPNVRLGIQEKPQMCYKKGLNENNDENTEYDKDYISDRRTHLVQTTKVHTRLSHADSFQQFHELVKTHT